ncbi:MAG: hypothetical protein INR65_16620 [Gluconacetobacter diazotrophicus]|nr:hypothetical protein [Gluconacetobacter diazotrophicus]
MTVRGATGATGFADTVSGSFHCDGLLLMTAGVARRALDRALDDALARLLAAPGFTAALLPPPLPTRPPAA